MSDHWNSLANLLGTPSLAPQKPKTESSSPAIQEVGATPASLPEAIPEAPVEKPKAEKSRLKTSWDAVANFFGVTTKEAEGAEEPPVTQPPAPSSPSSPKSSLPAKPAPRKGKPSMWEQAADDTTDTAPAPKEPDSLGRETSPRELPHRDIARREPSTREPSSREKPTNFVQDLDSDREPERRSHRRPPRRGRDSESQQGVSAPEREPSRPAGRQDARPQRSSSGRSATPASQEPRHQETRHQEPRHQETRPARKSSGFGAGLESTEESLESDFEVRDFEARDDDRDHRDERPHEEGVSGDDPEGRARRRRRRRGGRGRKQRDDVEGRDVEPSVDARAGRASRDTDDDENSQEDAPSIRHAKIPSWTETINVFVEANMLNHQRSQSSPRGNPRGRGRR